MECFKNEIWKDAVGYESLYQISDSGRVKSIKRLNYDINTKSYVWIFKENLLKPLINKKGYYTCVLYKNKKGKRIPIHRLVALAFIPNPNNKPQVNHINGNKLDNSFGNLEWVTNQENAFHAAKNNLFYKKFVPNDVKLIRKMRKNGHTYKSIAREFNSEAKHIWRIVNKKLFVYIE